MINKIGGSRNHGNLHLSLFLPFARCEALFEAFKHESMVCIVLVRVGLSIQNRKLAT